MQIVIDISENLYKATKNGLDAVEIWALRVAVTNGTPLPKGHWKIDEHLDKIGMIYKYMCSECGANHSAMYDYCPSCGSYNGGDTDAVSD